MLRSEADMEPLVMHTATKLGKVVTAMSQVLGEVPLTVKLRTGIKDSQNTAHKYMPRLATEWGASGLTVSFLGALSSLF